MQVQIENEYTGSDFSEILYFDYEKTAGDVVARVLSDAGCSYEAEVNILFTGEEEIREISTSSIRMASTTLIRRPGTCFSAISCSAFRG